MVNIGLELLRIYGKKCKLAFFCFEMKNLIFLDIVIGN